MSFESGITKKVAPIDSEGKNYVRAESRQINKTTYYNDIYNIHIIH